MGFIDDILPILKKHQLVFSNKRQETGDIVTFIFKIKEKLWWKAGRHGMVSVKTASGKVKGKSFSVASIPEEGNIMISTKISENPSEYKSALVGLKPGDTVTMNGPIGPFHLDDRTKPALFIAGGVGITPVRSILLNAVLEDNAAKADLQLLYISSNSEFPYKDEFDKLAKENDYIKVRYLNNRGELNSEIESYINKFNNGSYYFVSGSSSMVRGIKKFLKSKSIRRKNIKSDIFFGY